MQRVPPHAYFVGSAVFHYLGPAFAVLLFVRVDALGVAWLRIASAALVFALWRRPWRALRGLDRNTLLAWGAVLALMNCCFYLAIDRLPLATVAAIEFLPVIGLAALGARTPRNAAALVVAVPGVYLLTGIRLEGEPLGVALAFANAGLFALYIVLAHRAAQGAGVDALGAAMIVAAVAVTPLAGAEALPAFADPRRAGGGHRRRDLLVGDPVRVRPARDGTAAARHLCAAGVAAARHRGGDRGRGAGAGAVGRRGGRGHAGDRRRRAAPSTRASASTSRMTAATATQWTAIRTWAYSGL